MNKLFMMAALLFLPSVTLAQYIPSYEQVLLNHDVIQSRFDVKIKMPSSRMYTVPVINGCLPLATERSDGYGRIRLYLDYSGSIPYNGKVHGGEFIVYHPVTHTGVNRKLPAPKLPEPKTTGKTPESKGSGKAPFPKPPQNLIQE